MSLILYPPNETAFDTNGLGVLTDAIEAEVYEELNGQFELTVTYPVTGRHFARIVNDAYITARPDPVRAPQPFRIYRVIKLLPGFVTIYARHRAYQLRKIITAPFTADSAPAALLGLKNNATPACPFDFWTDKDTAATMSVKAPTPVWTQLGGSKGSVLDTYGGEYEFDGATVKLWSRRGADRGVSIRYGKNLTSFQQDENNANVYTGVYPYWTDGEGNLVQLPERYISAPGTFDEEKIMPLDLSQEFEEKPTEEQLRARTEQYIATNDIGKPDISWTVEFIQLEQTEEYKGKAILQQVLLGDTVHVPIPKLDVDVSARAVAVRYLPLLKRYKNVTLGSVKANLASTIAAQSRAIQDTLRMVQAPSIPANSDDNATSWITNGKGYMVAVRDADGNWIELCSLDTPDITTAKHIWRWNNGGLGFSGNGYGGPYEVAITQDGHIVGKFIKVGRIESSDGLAYFDLDNGFFAVDAEKDAKTLDGLRLKGGELYGYRHPKGDGEGNSMTTFEIIARTDEVLFCDGILEPSSLPIRIYSGGGLNLGHTDVQTEIRGKTVRFRTGDGGVVMGGKKLVWLEKDGYAYLVGVDDSAAT